MTCANASSRPRTSAGSPSGPPAADRSSGSTGRRGRSAAPPTPRPPGPPRGPLSHLEMIRRGFYFARRGFMSLSLPPRGGRLRRSRGRLRRFPRRASGGADRRGAPRRGRRPRRRERSGVTGSCSRRRSGTTATGSPGTRSGRARAAAVSDPAESAGTGRERIARLRDAAPERYAIIRRVTLVGAAVDLVLAVAKIAGGLLAHSQSLVADGVHSLSDLVTDVLVLFAARARPREAGCRPPLWTRADRDRRHRRASVSC